MSQRAAQAERLLAAFDWELPHALKTCELALALFDQLEPLHGLGSPERDVLEAAALLHDIGWTVSGKLHHKRSAELIRNNRKELSMFSAHEVDMIALVARYHRKSLPGPKHKEFAGLPEPQRTVVCKLASLLRLADGLDRPHLQAVRSIRCEVGGRHVRIFVDSPVQCRLHIEGAARKRELFEAVFGRSVEFLPFGSQ
ncbi:MAG: HD domain-containing protein [Verrucomicrobiae bacterium]|nr:HD domain-containing protein [Verrucomicrobiae bacterium]